MLSTTRASFDLPTKPLFGQARALKTARREGLAIVVPFPAGSSLRDEGPDMRPNCSMLFDLEMIKRAPTRTRSTRGAATRTAPPTVSSARPRTRTCAQPSSSVARSSSMWSVSAAAPARTWPPSPRASLPLGSPSPSAGARRPLRRATSCATCATPASASARALASPRPSAAAASAPRTSSSTPRSASSSSCPWRTPPTTPFWMPCPRCSWAPPRPSLRSWPRCARRWRACLQRTACRSRPGATRMPCCPSGCPARARSGAGLRTILSRGRRRRSPPANTPPPSATPSETARAPAPQTTTPSCLQCALDPACLAKQTRGVDVAGHPLPPKARGVCHPLRPAP